MANHKPLFLYHADLRKLLNKSDKPFTEQQKLFGFFLT